MAVKSVIEVDVKDDAFKSFARIFQKYQDQLAKSPLAWKQVNSSVAGTRKSFEQLVADQVESIAKQELMNEALKEAKRLVTTTSETWLKATRTVADNWRSIARSSLQTTATMGKWALGGAALGLLGSAAGLFGIEHLGENVTARRRSAGGLGVGYGQQQSFGFNFQRFVDPDALLGGVSEAKSDVTSRGYVGLLAAGITQSFLSTHNAAEVSAALLKQIPHLFGGTPEALVSPKLQALGLDRFLSQADVRRYLAASPAERAQQEGAYRGDSQSLDLTKGQQQAWNDFTTQLDRAGKKIETTFVIGLSPLTKPLETLSKSFTEMAESFLKSPLLKQWIGDVATGLEQFSKYIGTPEFKEGVETFAKGVIDISKALAGFVQWVGAGGSPTPTVGEKPGHDTWNSMVQNSRKNRAAVASIFSGGAKDYVGTHAFEFDTPSTGGMSATEWAKLVRGSPGVMERATGVKITVENNTGGSAVTTAKTAGTP